jgi:hypothetical protein
LAGAENALPWPCIPPPPRAKLGAAAIVASNAAVRIVLCM